MKTPKQPTIEEKKAREQRIHERRMKHKRPKKRFQFWKNIEFWVIFGLFAFIAYTRYVYHNNTELLNDDYKITTGYIYKEGGFRTSVASQRLVFKVSVFLDTTKRVCF